MINNSYLRFILIGSITFLVIGCSGSSWQHAYKSENTFYAEKNSCKAEANRVYPPLMSTPSNYGSNNTNTTCTSTSYNTVNCSTSADPWSGFYAATSRSSDKNKSAKGYYYDDCIPVSI